MKGLSDFPTIQCYLKIFYCKIWQLPYKMTAKQKCSWWSHLINFYQSYPPFFLICFWKVLFPHVMIYVHVCSVTKLCPTLWDPMLCNLTSFSIHLILKVRILEWVARDQILVSCTADTFFNHWATTTHQLVQWKKYVKKKIIIICIKNKAIKKV